MMHRALEAPCDPGEVSTHLLIGNSLPLYREVLTGTLRTLRPDVPVRSVAPADLDAAVACLRPWLVICSALSSVVEELAPAWIMLNPDEEPATLVSVAGERRVIPHPTLDELVELVDAARQAMAK